MLGIYRIIKNKFEAALYPIKYLRRIGVKVGEGCKIFSLNPGAFGSEPYLVSIGSGVIITQGVRFITHDGSTFLFRAEHPDLDVMGPITVGDNVFIGMNSIIMPGVTIGDNCVIGAMSLVSRSVPAGSVVAGNPAKVIMTIDKFKSNLIERNCGTGNLDESTKRNVLLELGIHYDLNNRTWKKYFAQTSIRK
jgi:acetyltransferase-like isoleucine patch superfamily enzyme